MTSASSKQQSDDSKDFLNACRHCRAITLPVASDCLSQRETASSGTDWRISDVSGDLTGVSAFFAGYGAPP